MLACALLEVEEPDEAERVAIAAMADSAPQDVINFALGKAVLARVEAGRGRLDEAEQLVRDAVDYAFRSDFPVVRADALVALARVLAARGRVEEAAEALEQAIGLYEGKGETRAAERARELSAGLSTAGP
jgi:tetratricopeptide (TPR) repeat protein